MPLISDHLTVWEIAFRWAGYDPDRTWWRIPLAVRDNLRTLSEAIAGDEITCLNLFDRHEVGDRDIPQMFTLESHYDAMRDCIAGTRYERKFLKFAFVERWAFLVWCQRRNIPLPEFWFPSGWLLDYQWPEAEDNPQPVNAGESIEEQRQHIDARHRAKMACQQIASALWAKEPTLTIKEVANRREVQELGGGAGYEIETVQEWISPLDPRDPTKKRGRKRKNNSAPAPVNGS